MPLQYLNSSRYIFKDSIQGKLFRIKVLSSVLAPTQTNTRGHFYVYGNGCEMLYLYKLVGWPFKINLQKNFCDTKKKVFFISGLIELDATTQ